MSRREWREPGEGSRMRHVLKCRDGARCTYCRRPPGTGEPFSGLTLDHVLPWAHGGTDALENLVLACKACNKAKADGLPQDFRPFLAGIA
jgi:5-methylcytosine-specific restriction endonuclease McrA